MLDTSASLNTETILESRNGVVLGIGPISAEIPNQTLFAARTFLPFAFPDQFVASRPVSNYDRIDVRQILRISPIQYSTRPIFIRLLLK